MRIFHIATVSDWAQAQQTGVYTTSTRGRTLAEEGFVHASRGDQWQGVRDRFYRDVDEPLVLLTIDTELLTSPVVDEPVPDSDETFPHVYGAINVDAVVRAIPLDPDPDPDADTAHPSFARVYLTEVYRRVAVALVVMVVVAAGAVAGATVDDRWGGALGAVVALAVGLLALRLPVLRRLRLSRLG